MYEVAYIDGETYSILQNVETQKRGKELIERLMRVYTYDGIYVLARDADGDVEFLWAAGN